jgi:hypothetical protein
MLPIVFSISRGEPSTVPFDQQQRLEILMTLGQSLVGMVFLINMELMWWEATALFSLWFIQFIFSTNAELHIHEYVTYIYLGWAGIELFRLLIGRRPARAFTLFRSVWRKHVRSAAVK